MMRKLTQRELEVALQVASAKCNKHIARELGMSPQTVKNHLHNIFIKLGIGDRLALARLVYQEVPSMLEAESTQAEGCEAETAVLV
jgi:DNA-binding NarL/FixJ family response regulator